MIRKIFYAGLLLAMSAVFFSGCTQKDADSTKTTNEVKNESTGSLTETTSIQETTEAPVDYEKLYGGVLDRYYKLIVSGDDSVNPEDGQTGIMEAMIGSSSPVVLESIGYAIQDISGDGVPELIIADTSSDNSIYAVYTYINNAPQFVFEGWARNRYMLLDDGRIYNESSGGAMYLIFGTYKLSNDGTALECEDYYFTYEKDDTFKNIGFYHNTSGIWDRDASEELNISEDEFTKMQQDFENKIRKIEVTPFSQYVYSDDKGKVSAVWYSDVADKLTVYDEFSVYNNVEQVKVVFQTDRDVTDFKLLTLNVTGVDANGNMSYESEEIYSQDKLTVQRPLVVAMAFHGDLPSYAVSYVDESGEAKRYTVEISGENGALVLNEFK